MKSMPGYVDFYKKSVLVPVPLHSRKKRERGFNQSEWIASVLSGIGKEVCV